MIDISGINRTEPISRPATNVELMIGLSSNVVTIITVWYELVSKSFWDNDIEKATCTREQTRRKKPLVIIYEICAMHSCCLMMMKIDGSGRGRRKTPDDEVCTV